MLHEEGVVVEKNDNLASQFYQQAIDKGNAKAHKNLAFLILNKHKKGENLDGIAHKMSSLVGAPPKEINPMDLLAQAAKLGDETSKDFISTKLGSKIISSFNNVAVRNNQK